MKPFSLERWKSLTDQGQQQLSVGELTESLDAFESALAEAQKLIDDVNLSAGYEHSARLYKTSCYNAAKLCLLQGNAEQSFHFYQLAYAQIQLFADQQALNQLTRYNALITLDSCVVALLEYYQNPQNSAHAESKKISAALIEDHVQFMQKHDNKNLKHSLYQIH